MQQSEVKLGAELRIRDKYISGETVLRIIPDHRSLTVIAQVGSNWANSIMVSVNPNDFDRIRQAMDIVEGTLKDK